MPAPKAVIAFDMDGTLLDEEERLRPQDRKLLIERDDVFYVVASGRQRLSIHQTFKDNEFYVNGPMPLGLVLINGCAIYKPGEQLVETRTFDPELQKNLIEVLENLPQCPFLLQGLDEMALIHPTPFAEELVQFYDIMLKPFTPEFYNHRLTKILCWSDDPEHLKAVEQAVQEIPLETCRSTPVIFEMNPTGVNKGEALRRLMTSMELEHLPVVAAGDGGNDIHLLRTADWSFAPASAPAEIRAEAREVLDTTREGLLTAMLNKAEELI